LLIDATDPAGAVTPALAAALQALAFSKLLAHGSWGPCGSVDTFFVFAGLRCALDNRVSDVLEIVVPHLRAAFVRLQSRKMKPPAPNRARALTTREREILLHLQHGRSNAEIGAALAISPLTVKNHVQKILRKLGVRNRTQAVALDVSQRWRRFD
jgi:DNA-binding NarL/FixJ family response regulator